MVVSFVRVIFQPTALDGKMLIDTDEDYDVR